MNLTRFIAENARQGIRQIDRASFHPGQASIRNWPTRRAIPENKGLAVNGRCAERTARMLFFT